MSVVYDGIINGSNMFQSNNNNTGSALEWLQLFIPTGVASSIASVHVYARTSCCTSRNKFVVSINGGNSVPTKLMDSTTQHYSASVNYDYITIQHPSGFSKTDDFLPVAEVQLFAADGSKVGISGTAASSWFWWDWGPSYVFDGIIDGSATGNLFITGNTSPDLEWLQLYIPKGQGSTIASVHIYGETDCCTNRNNFMLSINGANSVPTQLVDASIQHYTASFNYDYITIQHPSEFSKADDYLTISEIQLFVTNGSRISISGAAASSWLWTDWGPSHLFDGIVDGSWSGIFATNNISTGLEWLQVYIPKGQASSVASIEIYGVTYCCTAENNFIVSINGGKSIAAKVIDGSQQHYSSSLYYDFITIQHPFGFSKSNDFLSISEIQLFAFNGSRIDISGAAASSWYWSDWGPSYVYDDDFDGRWTGTVFCTDNTTTGLEWVQLYIPKGQGSSIAFVNIYGVTDRYSDRNNFVVSINGGKPVTTQPVDVSIQYYTASFKYDYVIIQHPSTAIKSQDFLQISEVQLFDNNGININILGVSASSNPKGFPLSRLYDGRIDGNFYANNVFVSSNTSFGHEWLQLYIAKGKGASIAFVDIYARTDCCIIRNGFVVSVNSGAAVSATLVAESTQYFSANLKYDYITIQHPIGFKKANDYLQISEVRLFDASSVQIPVVGATASSAYGGLPTIVYDGNTNGIIDDKNLYRTVFVSNNINPTLEWLKLSIAKGKGASIASVQVYARTDCCFERNNLLVSINGGIPTSIQPISQTSQYYVAPVTASNVTLWGIHYPMNSTSMTIFNNTVTSLTPNTTIVANLMSEFVTLLRRGDTSNSNVTANQYDVTVPINRAFYFSNKNNIQKPTKVPANATVNAVVAAFKPYNFS
ncbi:UNVERIFIED_CONTAM: hypothetical protein HDU68_003210, partial [Siphonaria sp. JEL0065]